MLTYLAIGDSYTIGESVKAEDNFPNQTARMLNERGKACGIPEIIAKTGWSTDELEEAIWVAAKEGWLKPPYDLVTLLIGVNDQYRRRNVDDYKPAFEKLLKIALEQAGNYKDHVIVLSIPDWGVTPFASDSDRFKIAEEIDDYNTVNSSISEQLDVPYINITPWTREAYYDLSLLASDGLHPSGKEYARWAEAIVKIFIQKS